MNGTEQLLVCADVVNILGGNVCTVGEKTEALVVACGESGLGVNADKTKYMVVSRDQNAERSYGMNLSKGPLPLYKKHTVAEPSLKALFGVAQ